MNKWAVSFKNKTNKDYIPSMERKIYVTTDGTEKDVLRIIYNNFGSDKKIEITECKIVKE